MPTLLLGLAAAGLVALTVALGSQTTDLTWYSTDDPWITPSQVITWAAATNVQLRILGDVNHDPWTPAAIRPHLQAAWIWDQLAVSLDN